MTGMHSNKMIFDETALNYCPTFLLHFGGRSLESYLCGHISNILAKFHGLKSLLKTYAAQLKQKLLSNQQSHDQLEHERNLRGELRLHT